jgi:hypothetical protein
MADIGRPRHVIDKNAERAAQRVDSSSEPRHSPQDELVRSMVEIETRYTEVYHLDDEEHAALRRSAEDIRKNRFATNKDVETVFGRFRHA